MAAVTTPLEVSAPSRREVAVIWGGHLLSLYLPANALLFLWTGPHVWYVAFLFMAPLVAAHQLDCAPRYEVRQPREGLPAWPFDALVYGLAALQFWLIVELVRLFSVQGVFSFDAIIAFLVVGGSSGFSIVTAHELIHRRKRWERNLGRLLLCTVLYEHFFTEHIRGHHARVGTPEDPATARFGESYEAFFRRTVPGQFRSAWSLELVRLGDPDMGLFDRRMLRNRIVHGLALEWCLALAILGAFGVAALFAFLLQALSAVRLLEAVNYFEHWGLTRRGPRPRPEDSWDTHSWFTYYALIGLTRHADHHSAATRPYQKLRVRAEAPLLPAGYIGTVDLVMGRNADFQQLATRELASRRLGPFDPRADGDDAPADTDSLELLRCAQAGEGRPRHAPGLVARNWRRLPSYARRAIAVGGILSVTAAGVQWETGGAQMGFPERFALHAWMLASFVVVLAGRRWIAERVGENVSWVFVFAAILAAGLASSAFL
jgi:alkane 1-monooxygenase